MTDAEISRRLALEIGWKADEIRIDHTWIQEPIVEVWYTLRNAPENYKIWRRFDYRDPSVIWPIAERFDCFPLRLGKKWAAQKMHAEPVASDTAAKAVALAVIKAHEVKK